MEKLRRNLRIFWTEHSDPILFYTIFIVIIILVVQGLNALAIKNKEKKEETVKNNIVQEGVKQITKEEEKVGKELIESFISYCKKGDIKQSYSLLSEKCKKEQYPTINEFKEKYYNKNFNKNIDIEVEYSYEYIYKVTFYENNMLETGQIENRNKIAEQYYKIDPEIVEDKIYINYQKK